MGGYKRTRDKIRFEVLAYKNCGLLECDAVGSGRLYQRFGDSYYLQLQFTCLPSYTLIIM